MVASGQCLAGHGALPQPGPMSQASFPFQRHWAERCSGLDATVDATVLFDSPDRLLTLLQLSPEEMVAGYRQLLSRSESPYPFWRLEHAQRPAVEPLSGALIRVMLPHSPKLLELYQAVDLRSGGDGDGDYLNRLDLVLQPDGLLEAWRTIGELRGELDHQLLLVDQQRDQLKTYQDLLKRSQRLLDRLVSPLPDD